MKALPGQETKNGIISSILNHPSFPYLLPVLVTCMLGLWGAHAQNIVNPDGVLYLRSAELFASGSLQEALELYKWPFYSILIGTLMWLTDSSAFIAAQIVNIACSAASAVIVVLIVRDLTGRNRTSMIAIAFLITMHSGLTDWRPAIIRDHGFIAFALAAIFLSIRQCSGLSWKNTALIIVAGFVASLFRIEGVVVLGLALLFPLITGNRARSWLSASIALTFAFAVTAAALMWFGAADAGSASYAERAFQFIEHRAILIEQQIDRLRSVFSKYEKNNAEISYFVLCFVYLAAAVIKASRLHVVILAGYTMLRKNFRHDEPLLFKFLCWYLPGALLIITIFTLLHFFLPHRYALLTSIILNIPLALVLPKIYTEWRSGNRQSKAAAWLFPIITIIFVFDWLTEIPKPTKISDLRVAGEWIAENAENAKAVASNDGRVLYYAGTPFSADEFRDNVVLFPVKGNPAVEWKTYEIVAIAAVGPDLENTILENFGLAPRKVVAGSRGRRVLIYDLKS